MKGQLDEHIRPPAWVGLAAGTAPASYFRLIRHGTLLPRTWPTSHSWAAASKGRPVSTCNCPVTSTTSAVGVALYRIAREAVTNAVRHARSATRVTVRVADEGKQVRLTISDDGDTTSGHTTAGYGVLGMTERAALLGGMLTAGPAPKEAGRST